jgi:hypothetical protein
MGPLLHKLRRLGSEIARRDLPLPDQATNVVEKTLKAMHLWPNVLVGRELFYELRSPPPEFRGLRDLTARPGSSEEAAAICAVDAADPKLVAGRFAQGDLVFLGELDRRILAHVWFHRGPTPFAEDEPDYPSWDVPAGSFWSYHAISVMEARSSGVFVKAFQRGLRALFLEHGAALVRCRVKSTNLASIALHERMGFRRVGTLSVFSLAGLRGLYWDGEAGPRWSHHRLRPGKVLVLPPA